MTFYHISNSLSSFFLYTLKKASYYYIIKIGDIMKKFLNFISLILCGIILISLCSCGKAYLKECIYFNLSAAPVSLDPQTASDDNELLIVRNTFEGLLRKDKDGKITNGAAESYEKNGLTYTFKIRKNSEYFDGTKLTAADFVFAFKRAVDPKTAAPFAKRLKAVGNAGSILAGKADKNSLAVRAEDDYTLEIRLDSEDEFFLDTLTTSVCMPCNEKFFNKSVGKYGLEKKYVLANGSYYIGRWNTDDFGIRLYKNNNYKGDFSALNASVFLSHNTEKSAPDLIKDNTFDMAFLKNGEIENAKKNGFNVKSCQNSLIVMTVGQEFSKEIALAIGCAAGRSVYEKLLPEGFEVADGIYPDIITEGLNTDLPAYEREYNIEKAKELISSAVKRTDDKVFPSATLYYFDDESIKPAVSAIVSHWQQNLSAFVNIKPSSNKDALTSELKNQTLQFAVFPVKANSPRPEEFLELFGADGSDLFSAQKKILNSGRIIPLAFSSVSAAYPENISNVFFDSSNGYIDFSFVIKKGQ